MGNSVIVSFLGDDTSKERASSEECKRATKQSADNTEGAWRENLGANSVVRVWDTVFQTSYPAVVTRAGEREVNLRFCPKYPDGSYCGCVVDQKTTRNANIIAPYLSTMNSATKEAPRKESLLNAQCRTESLDHLSEMILGESKKNDVSNHNLVLTQGHKKAPPLPPQVVQFAMRNAPMPKQRAGKKRIGSNRIELRLDSIEE